MTVAHRKNTENLYLRNTRRVCLVVALVFSMIAGVACKGRVPLADDQVMSALRNDAKPDDIKTALADLHSRVAQGKSLETWAPELVRLSKHPEVTIRHTVADLMGEDPSRKEFRAALHEMLDRDTPLVCNAAAVSLASFDDSYGHELLAAMLRPVVLTAPRPGHVRSMMANGAKVSHGDAVLRLESAAQQTEVLATVSGKLRLEVETGDTVSGGSRLAVIEPNAEQMVTALKALQKIGKSQDVLYVAEVEADPVQPSDIREQAKLAHQRIIERTK